MIKRLSILLFSLIYAAIVLTTFAADRLAAMGQIETAIKLDPVNAELYFRKYELLNLSSREAEGDEAISKSPGLKPRASSPNPASDIQKQCLQLIKHAIDLRPLWPEYHLYYASTLEQMTPGTNFITRQVILGELKKAADLKPYSPSARKIYEKHLNSYE